MARRPTHSTQSAQSQQDQRTEPTTYSTRFTPEQREKIDEACAKLNWTPARFIRDASVRRAAEILNSSGSAQHQLAALAQRFVHQLVGKKRLCLTTLNFEREREDQEFLEEYAVNGEGYEQPDMLTAIKFSENEAKQIQAALQATPSEFARLILEYWNISQRGEEVFEARVNADDLLARADSAE